MKIYPPSSTSRTLDPSNKSFTTVVGRHDQRLSDADVNLIQDLQDFKRSQQIQNTVFSGALNYLPFRFDPTPGNENTFSFSAFDVMFNGEVVTIGGNNSTNLSTNNVRLPPPTTSPSPNLYVVYLELWYNELNPTTWKGYEPTTHKIYPNGCTTVDGSLLISDDVVDSFNNNLITTIRSQVQWAIRYAPLDLTYDFTNLNYGLDPGNGATQIVLAAGPNPGASSDPSLAFTNMGDINGDHGLWVSNNGVSSPLLPTLDGCSYAMPIAVVFRRNLDPFDQATAPFGCAIDNVAKSGLANPGPGYTPKSGRYDGKFADVIYDSDVVDTRMTVSLQGYDFEKLIKEGFVDLINGNTQLKIGRGDSIGSDPLALGSRVGYTLSVGGNTVSNIDNIGTFNGFINGFGLDKRPYYTVKTIPISAKTTGNTAGPWVKNDVFSLHLPTGYAFSYAVIQGLTQQGSSFSPVLLNGQVTISGLGTQSLTCSFKQDPLATFSPGTNPLQVFIGVVATTAVMYTSKVPYSMDFGRLADPLANGGNTMPVFAVSDFTPFKKLGAYTSYNPNYSNKVFGTVYDYSTVSDGTTTVTINLSDLPYKGAYVTKLSNGVINYPFTQKVSGTFFTLSIPVSSTPAVGSPLVASILLFDVAQMGYNAPVKGITSIKETVLFGTNAGSVGSVDSRINLVGTNVVGSNTSLIFATTDCILSGIGNGYLFVQNVDTTFSPIAITNVSYSNGYVTITVPSASLTPNFYMVGLIAPAFSSNTIFLTTFDYIPYQGDGKEGVDYSLQYSEEFALITTNGTGAAPIVGLKDVFPFNRELPITTSLPALSFWDDSELKNQGIATDFDNNYATKQYSNTDHTFMVPLKTNDFIEPVSGWKSKKIRFGSANAQGFSSAYPHVGFAVSAPKPKTTAGNFVFATTGSIIVYVNNVTGDDTYDGLSRVTAKKSIEAALKVLPPTLNHPCYVFLINTGTPFELVKADLSVSKLGDGQINPINHYSLSNLAFTIQNAGWLYIGRESGVAQRIVIDATSYYTDSPYTDGPASAFTIANSNIVFGGISFKGFLDQGLYATSSKISLYDCAWESNVAAAAFYTGCNVIVDGGSLSTNDFTVLENNVPINKTSNIGFIISSSDLISSNLSLNGPTITNPYAFYVCERGANLTLSSHTVNDETAVYLPTVVVNASLNSSVVCSPAFTSNGRAILATNSVLTYPSTGDGTGTFAGGISHPDNDNSTSAISSIV